MKYFIMIICMLLPLNFLFADTETLKSDSNEVMQELLDNKDDIIGVDLHVAGGYEDGPIYSRWGHAFIVFINKNERNYHNNIAISIGADVQGDVGTIATYAKGIAGSFKTKIEADYFYYFWEKHIVSEGRPLERLIIPLNENVKQALIKQLAEIHHNPEKMGNYNFLSNNCVGVASKILKNAGVPLKYTPRIPMNAGKAYTKSGITTSPIDRVESGLASTSKINAYLVKKEIKTYGQFTKELINELVVEFGADSVNAYIMLDKNLVYDHMKDFHKKYGNQLTKSALSASFKAIPQMYVLCSDIKCAAATANQEKNYYSNKAFSENAFQRHSNFKESNDEGVYSIHAKLMVQASKELASPFPLNGIKNSSKTKLIFELSGYENDQLVIHVCANSENNKTSCQSSYKKIMVPMSKKDDFLLLNNRRCVDLNAKEFTANCGVIKEDSLYKIYAY